MAKIKCQGSDCVLGSRELNPDEIRFCPRCSKPVCAWCLVHCDPSHQCDGDEDVQAEVERYRKEFTP